MPTTKQPNISFSPAFIQSSYFDPSSVDPLVPFYTRKSTPSIPLPSSIMPQVPSFSYSQQLQEQEQVEVCAQPFYVGEVDHQIQEIGLMAVKQVRYVDQEEWEEIVKEQGKYQEQIQKMKKEEIKEKRRVQAKGRVRNQRGQFLAKEKKGKGKAGNKIKKLNQKMKINKSIKKKRQ